MSHYSDAAVSKLREIVETIDRESVGSSEPLRAALAELVKVLALGPAPQTRVCPTCGGIGMRAASRCGNCWSSLERLPVLPEESSVRGNA